MLTFFSYDCPRCGGVDEAKFETAGPHVKQVCLHCGAYVKLFNKALIPSSAEIKIKIWQIAGENVNEIDKAKSLMGFIELPIDTSCYTSEWPRSLMERLQYWKLYLKIRSLIPIHQ